MKKIVDTTCFSVNEVQKRLCKTIDYLRLSGERTMIAVVNFSAKACICGQYNPADANNWEFAPAFSTSAFRVTASKCLQIDEDNRKHKETPILRMSSYLMVDGISFVKHASTVLEQKKEVTALFAMFFVCFYRRSELNKTGSLIRSRDCVVCIGSHHHAPRYYIKDSNKDSVHGKWGIIDHFYEALQY